MLRTCFFWFLYPSRCCYVICCWNHSWSSYLMSIKRNFCLLTHANRAVCWKHRAYKPLIIFLWGKSHSWCYISLSFHRTTDRNQILHSKDVRFLKLYNTDLYGMLLLYIFWVLFKMWFRIYIYIHSTACLIAW